MLMELGILMRESVIDDVQSAEEDAEYVIKNNVINNAIGGKENDRGNKFKKKSGVVFSKIKNDEFIFEWIVHGYPKDRGFIDCIDFFCSIYQFKICRYDVLRPVRLQLQTL